MAERFLGYEREELDRQYDMAGRHGDSHGLFRRLYADLSETARKRLTAHPDIAYGKSAGARLDLFPATRPGAPLVAFVTGGDWRSGCRRDYGFVALGLVPAGCAVAVIGYDLAPTVELDTMVSQVRSALRWLHRHAERANGDPRRLVVAGHAAGGHLAAMMLTADWATDDGQAGAASPLAGVAAVSALYDLEGIRLSFLNSQLQLDAAATARLSPLRLAAALTPAAPPVLLAVGEQETDEYHRNLAAYAGALEGRGVAVQATTRARHHHFSLAAELADPSGPITKQLIAFASDPAAADSAPI